MFSQDDYRTLSKYLKERAADLKKEEKENNSGTGMNLGGLVPEATNPERTNSDRLIAAARQLEVLRYDPMMVEALLEEYEVPMQALEDLPAHINDDDEILTQTIVRWRLERRI